MKKKNLIYSFGILSFLLIVFNSCEKSIVILPPTLTTSNISLITDASALVDGYISSNGGASIISFGVFWGASENPDITGEKIAINTADTSNGLGGFEINLTDLSPSTTYYVKSYAVNSEGLTLGDQISFTTQEVFTDIYGSWEGQGISGVTIAFTVTENHFDLDIDWSFPTSYGGSSYGGNTVVYNGNSFLINLGQNSSFSGRFTSNTTVVGNYVNGYTTEASGAWSATKVP